MSAPLSKDEARKLLGGYATGSLTEAERAALFQAALEDQELFDELADEAALKEVLDEPGARQRLITAIEPPTKHRAWLWITAVATLAIAAVIGIVVSRQITAPPPQQIAQVMKSPEPAAAPVEPVAPPAPAPAPAIIGRNGPPASPPAPAPPPELKKEENAAVAEQADQLQKAKPQAASEALRLNGLPQASEAAAIASRVFAFNYSVSPEGFLEITPTASGYLLVSASDAIVFRTTLVGVSTLRIAIPSGATSLVIAFSRMQGVTGTPVRRDAASGTVTDQDPPNGKILIQLFLTPATR